VSSASEDISSDDESSVSGDGVDFVVTSPLVDSDPPNHDVDMEEGRTHVQTNKNIY
jgi:hypothetical protein